MTRSLQSKIVAVRSTYNDVYEKLELVLDSLDEFQLRSCRTVSIKINLCDARTSDTGAITHPLVLDALLRYIRERHSYSAKINVVESDATVALPDSFIKWFGFLPVLESWNAKYINLSKDERIQKKIDGRFFRSIAVPRTIADSDCFISLAKLKTHGLTKITGALKNQFGCLPRVRKIKYHKHLDDAIVDANLAMRPNLSIVDGIITHVGNGGPAFGRPIPGNVVVVSNDPVAIDSWCAKVLGFTPYFVGHIRKAAEVKIGSMRDYDVKLIGFSKPPRVNPEFDLLDNYLIKTAFGIIRKIR